MIRTATFDDVPDLVELGRAMHAESPRYREMTFDADRLAETLHGVIAAGGFARVVQTEDGSLVGGLVAVLVPHWASDDLTSCDLALFMAPEARGSIAPARLLNQYAQWARDRGARQIMLGVMTGVSVPQTVALCERLGWRQAGVVMEC